jgi:simple sugar transport system permease protein
MPDTDGIVRFLKKNAIMIFFVAIALFTSIESNQSFQIIARDVSVRFFRNLVLVLALILPIIAGIGLNFGIVLGAMSAQIALIIVLATGQGASAFVFVYWAALTIVISAVSGYFLALLFNNTKGQEMIAGLLVGYFANGIYLFICMVLFGSIIKITDASLVISYGKPLKTTIDLPGTLYGGIDTALTIPYFYCVCATYSAVVVYYLVSFARKRVIDKTRTTSAVKIVFLTFVFVYMMINDKIRGALKNTSVPVITCLIGMIVIVFIWRVLCTKIGHDFLAIRNNMAVASAAGINVDRVRMTAIILSTVLAGLGQLIYVQNFGVLSTYTMHANMSTFITAAILMGGATVRSASVKHCIIGNFLFQIIYGTAPNATKYIFGNVQVGEYFRIFLCYGIIAVAIAVYGLQESRAAQRRLNVRN